MRHLRLRKMLLQSPTVKRKRGGGMETRILPGSFYSFFKIFIYWGGGERAHVHTIGAEGQREKKTENHMQALH